MADHRKRFERWRRKLPKNTVYLVDQVVGRVIPEFERRGFVWYPNFAEGDAAQIGANEIPLQWRSGKEWPTVQIRFERLSRPSFSLEFSMLPPICTRWELDGRVTEIPRESALVFEGTAFFSLCKGQGRDYDCNFGCLGITFFPYRRIDKDIGILLTLLPELFRLLDQGIPESWPRTKGFVTKHVFVSGARDSLGNAFIP